MRSRSFINNLPLTIWIVFKSAGWLVSALGKGFLLFTLQTLNMHLHSKACVSSIPGEGVRGIKASGQQPG